MIGVQGCLATLFSCRAINLEVPHMRTVCAPTLVCIGATPGIVLRTTRKAVPSRPASALSLELLCGRLLSGQDPAHGVGDALRGDFVVAGVAPMFERCGD